MICLSTCWGHKPEVQTDVTDLELTALVSLLWGKELVKQHPPPRFHLPPSMMQLAKTHTNGTCPPIFPNENSPLWRQHFNEPEHTGIQCLNLQSQLRWLRKTVKPQRGTDGQKAKLFPRWTLFVFLFSCWGISTKESIGKSHIRWHPIQEAFQVCPAGNDLALILRTRSYPALLSWIILFGCLFSLSLAISSPLAGLQAFSPWDHSLVSSSASVQESHTERDRLQNFQRPVQNEKKSLTCFKNFQVATQLCPKQGAKSTVPHQVGLTHLEINECPR